ncbi:uncharacterized protein LOC110861027 [Folsomia candida]|uniref:Uncharacterized protein n=1 Tax=Folsomia candida TaxID=158441 RepID=A0A226D4R7_FOLCA|nr:uncharacterized protein LOC110861027 [Folsomia candida]OXA39737.1 hypothetical protein Fcan01_25591 [Folsomia candida]
MFLRLCAFLSCVSFAVGYVQEVTFYTEYAFQGDALRLRSKHAELTPCQLKHIANTKTFCAVGSWQGFEGQNYTGRVRFTSTSGAAMNCQEKSFKYSPIKSLRYLGQLETLMPSISVNSGSNDSDTGGIERTFTNLAANNFGFIPAHLVLTGGSNWTGFSNEDFTGESTCFSTSELHVGISPHPSVVRSLFQGCDAKYGSEIYESAE